VKKYCCQIIVVGSLILVLLMATCAAAQDQEFVPERSARLNIPFAFYAGPASLPAGEYPFEIDPVGHTVFVQQDATGQAIFLTGIPANPVQNGKPLLTFESARGEYKLKELQCDSVGLKFVPARISTLSPYDTH
jgi:hypothetical protein